MAGAEQQWTIEQHRTPARRVPIVGFLNGLTDERAKKESAMLVRLLGEMGNTIRPPRSKLVKDGIYELRGHQVRIFYVFRPGRRIVLLDGEIKKRDDIPKEVLARVQQYQRESDEQERRREKK